MTAASATGGDGDLIPAGRSTEVSRAHATVSTTRSSNATRGDIVSRSNARHGTPIPHRPEHPRADRPRRTRFTPTRSEERLWRRLSGSKAGFAFRRQHVIGPAIVDFACTKVRLVVEVDGPYHEQRERPDAQRDRLLAQLGWNFLRIEEHHVFDYLEHVVERIVSASALRR